MKEACGNLFNSWLKHSIDLRIKLHEEKLINAMPIYWWLLSDTSLMDIGEDCVKVSIDWAIKKTGQSEFTGKIVTIFKSPVHNHEEMMYYSEYTAAVLNDFENPDIGPYKISEFSSNGDIIIQLEKKIWGLNNF